jgi:hypothetical protein
MSIRDFFRFDLNPSGLPTWRKIVLLCAAGLFIFLGGMATFKELKIYESAPSAAVAATQQIYPVHVMHGYVRYVTRAEEEDFVFWKQRLGTLVGMPFIVAFLVLVTFRKGREGQVPGQRTTP